MEIKKIFLDVDGVLACWTMGVCKLFDLDYEKDFTQNWKGTTVEETLGISKKQLWATIDRAGSDFWANLPLFDNAMDLYRLCKETAPTVLLTSPSLDPSCGSGKMQWIQKHFGRHFRDFLIGPPKASCAQPGHVLIDDTAKQCNAFIEANGDAILYPTVRNGGGEKWDQIEYVRSRLQILSEEPHDNVTNSRRRTIGKTKAR